MNGGRSRFNMRESGTKIAADILSVAVPKIGCGWISEIRRSVTERTGGHVQDVPWPMETEGKVPKDLLNLVAHSRIRLSKTQWNEGE